MFLYSHILILIHGKITTMNRRIQIQINSYGMFDYRLMTGIT